MIEFPFVRFYDYSLDPRNALVQGAEPGREILRKSPTIEIKTIDIAELRILSKQRGRAVVIIFSGEGCIPCDKLKDEMKVRMIEFEGRVTFSEFMVSDRKSFEAAESFKIANQFPTVLIFNKGAEKGRIIGYGEHTSKRIAEMLKTAMSRK